MNDPQKRVRFRQPLADPKGTIAPGVADPLFARLASDCGYLALHLSGNALHKSLRLPDRNLVTFTEIGRSARLPYRRSSTSSRTAGGKDFSARWADLTGATKEGGESS
jgi:hypothetical protein